MQSQCALNLCPGSAADGCSGVVRHSVQETLNVLGICDELMQPLEVFILLLRFHGTIFRFHEGLRQSTRTGGLQRLPGIAPRVVVQESLGAGVVWGW